MKVVLVVYGLLLKDDAVAELLCLIDEAVLSSIDETAFVIASPNDVWVLLCVIDEAVLSSIDETAFVIVVASWLPKDVDCVAEIASSLLEFTCTWLHWPVFDVPTTLHCCTVDVCVFDWLTEDVALALVVCANATFDVARTRNPTTIMGVTMISNLVVLMLLLRTFIPYNII
jgi:hypothetical protein